MASEEQEPQGTKFIDRRRFTSEGDLRPEAAEAEAQAATEEKEKAKETETTPPPSAPHTGGEAKNFSASAGEPTPEPAFESLLMSLSATAMAQLGLVEDPEEGRLPADIPGARQTIDLLAALESKTRGNLTPQEKDLFDQLLAELRMLYVRISSGQISPPFEPGT